MSDTSQDLPYDSVAVANFVIRLARDQGRSLSIMRVLKVAYMAHGWTLAVRDQPLVDEFVQAWKFGPVIPSIYYTFRPYGAYDLDVIKIVRNEEVDTETGTFLEHVYRMYEGVSDWELSRLTHVPGGPWAMCYRRGGRGIIIPNEMIKGHFSDKLKRARNGQSS